MRDHPERLVFIDETSLKTNMTKAHGWAPVGDRLIDHAPAGRWTTQTFIAGLRHDRIDATGIISGAMDKDMFDLRVEGTLAPTLRPGDVFGPLTRTDRVRGLTPRHPARASQYHGSRHSPPDRSVGPLFGENAPLGRFLTLQSAQIQPRPKPH